MKLRKDRIYTVANSDDMDVVLDNSENYGYWLSTISETPFPFTVVYKVNSWFIFDELTNFDAYPIKSKGEPIFTYGEICLIVSALIHIVIMVVSNFTDPHNTLFYVILVNINLAALIILRAVRSKKCY